MSGYLPTRAWKWSIQISYSKRSTSRAFTLVELLVSISIVGILVGMLMPAVNAIREAARRTHCKSNTRQVALALLQYESAHQVFPPGQLASDEFESPTYPDFEGHQLLGHLGYALPYLEQNNLRSAFDPLNWSIDEKTTAWYLRPDLVDSASTLIPVLRCPSDTDENGQFVCLSILPFNGSSVRLYEELSPNEFRGWTNYLGSSGYLGHGVSSQSDGIFYARSKTTTADVSDGLSNTVLAGEVIGGFGADQPRNSSIDVRHSVFSNGIGVHAGFNSDRPDDGQDTLVLTFSSRHAGQTVNFAFADGSVRNLHSFISPDVLESLVTRRGGELIDSDD